MTRKNCLAMQRVRKPGKVIEYIVYAGSRYSEVDRPGSGGVEGETLRSLSQYQLDRRNASERNGTCKLLCGTCK
jgi:hypothetical protein